MVSKSRSIPPSSTRLQTARASLGLRTPDGWLDLAGCRVAWKASGDPDGRAVICLHSLGSGSREFRPLFNFSLPGIRLVTLDWPGNGRSEDSAPVTAEEFPCLLFELINRLDIARPILLASGSSAAAAIHFAKAHPLRTLALVLCQPEGLFPPLGNTLDPPSNCWTRVRRLASNPPRTPAERQRARLRAFQRLEQAQQGATPYPLNPPAEQTASADLRAALRTLPSPALFAFSRESRSHPLRRYLDLLEPLLVSSPQHRFTVFSGSFNPIWDEPARFAKALTGFVQAQLPLGQHRHAWLLSAVDWPTRGVNLWKCVHPLCAAERVLPVGADANAANSTPNPD